jgi:hypothetical protein
MAMSKAIRKELGKGRELLWHLLEGKNCYFCKEPLLEDGVPSYVKFGNGSAPPLDLEITIHHVNESHNDNRPENRKLAHTSCHRSHHAILIFKQWRKEAA